MLLDFLCLRRDIHAWPWPLAYNPYRLRTHANLLLTCRLHSSGTGVSANHGGKEGPWPTMAPTQLRQCLPHAFDPAALGPLLSHHCSVQAYGFYKSKGICRVDAYTLNARSIPQSGHTGLQYPKKHGVSNVVFPVTMKTYIFSQAPDLEEETDEDDCPINPAGSEASFDTGNRHIPCTTSSNVFLLFLPK